MLSRRALEDMKPLDHANLENVLSALHKAVGCAAPASDPGQPGASAPATEAERKGVDHLLQDLHEELHLVLVEHGGMAEELLRAYEQLGIVFEVTRQVARVSSEKEVVRLFGNSLRITYHDNEIRLAERSGDDLSWSPSPPPARESVVEVVEESIAGSRLVVRTLPSTTDGVDEIMSAPVFSGEDFVCAIVFTHGPAGRRFVASDMSLVEALLSFCGDLVRKCRLTEELRGMSMNLVRALVSAIDQKDAYTSGHSNRVGQFAKLLGAALGMDNEELQMLEWAALLHDAGKIGIRDDVLKKPGKLTTEELEHIREHPVRSHELVRRVPQLKASMDGIRHHHERYDGSGYPDGLAGEDIPLQARVILVADVFDALTTSRSYRAAFDVETALDIMRQEAGRVSDPALVSLFEEIIRREIAHQRISFERFSCQSTSPGRDTSERNNTPEECTK